MKTEPFKRFSIVTERLLAMYSFSEHICPCVLLFPQKVRDTDTIERVKELVQEHPRGRIPPDQQRLIFAGKQLQVRSVWEIFTVKKACGLSA